MLLSSIINQYGLIFSYFLNVFVKWLFVVQLKSISRIFSSVGKFDENFMSCFYSSSISWSDVLINSNTTIDDPYHHLRGCMETLATKHSNMTPSLCIALLNQTNELSWVFCLCLFLICVYLFICYYLTLDLLAILGYTSSGYTIISKLMMSAYYPILKT